MDVSAALLWLLVLVAVAGVQSFASGQEITEDQRRQSQVDDLEEELKELKATGEEATLTIKSATQGGDMYLEDNQRNWSANTSRFEYTKVNTPIVNETEEVERLLFPEPVHNIKNEQPFVQNAFGKMKEISQEPDKENSRDVQEENDTVIREFHKVAEDLLELLIHIAERPSQWDKLIRKLNAATENGNQSESLTSNKREKIIKILGTKVTKLDNLALANKHGTKDPIKEKQIYTLNNWKDRNLRMKQLLKAGIVQTTDQLATYDKYQKIDENEVTNSKVREPPILHSNFKLDHEKENQIDYMIMQPEKEILQFSKSKFNKFPLKAMQESQYMKTHNPHSQRKSNETHSHNKNNITVISEYRSESTDINSSIRIPEARQSSGSGARNNTGQPESRNSLPDGHRWPHFTYHRVTSRPAHRASHRDAYIAVSVSRGTQPAIGVGLGQRDLTTPTTTSTTAAPRVETIGRVLRMRDPLEEELVDMAAARMPPAPQRYPIPLPVSFVAWSHAQHLNKLQEQIKSLAAMEDKLNYKSADRERLRQILRDGKSDPVQPIRAM